MNIPQNRSAPRADSSAGLVHAIDEFSHYRGTLSLAGWAFHRYGRIVCMGYGTGERMREVDFRGEASDDVVAVHGKQAQGSRFRLVATDVDAGDLGEFRLEFVLEDGSVSTLRNLGAECLANDPYHRLTRRFFNELHEIARPRILEIGSRARSGITRRDRLPKDCEYVGFDILAGENVDVVGDAHALASRFDRGSFDAVFSISVFEHLAMPWKACLEINRVLKPGGLLFVSSHQTFPLHEVPWDFFRFSDQAWHGMLNAATGFKVVETALGEPAAVVARTAHAVTRGMELCPAYLGSAVLARKVSETRLEWPVDSAQVVSSPYPA